MTLFVIVQVFTVFAIGLFCVVGSLVSMLRSRRERRRLDAHELAASLVLTDDHDELETTSAALAALPNTVLADVLHGLSVDLHGEARRRLRLVSDRAGLTHRIRRWSTQRQWTRRIRAAHLLMLLPTDSPERRRLVTDPHPLVRARAIEGLGRSGVGRYTPHLLDAFDHESPAVRSAAQHALVLGGVDCVPPILRLLERLDRGVVDGRAVRLVAEVAAQLPDSRLVEALLRFVSHPDPELRVLVATCLGNGTFAEPEIHLSALLNDDDARVRAEAAMAVGRGDVRGLAHELGRALSDSSWAVRRNSGEALAQLGPIGRVVLRCHLDDDDAFARDMALHSLGRTSRLDDVLSSGERWAVAS